MIRDYSTTGITAMPVREKKDEKTLVSMQYERFLRMSNYAYLLLMPDYTERWFDKRSCKLDRVKKIIFVPIALYNKIKQEVK